VHCHCERERETVIEYTDWRIRLTFEVGYTATRVQPLDTETNCCLFWKIQNNKIIQKCITNAKLN